MPHASSAWSGAFTERLGGDPREPGRFAELMCRPEFPRASAYDPSWAWRHLMGPNVLWLTDPLTQLLELQPGMRVLDMGCGTAVSSIFLAREFDLEVWATDLWIPPHENMKRVFEAGLGDATTAGGTVYPVHAEARAFPFQRDFFDVALSVESFHYWGRDPAYIDYLAGFVKPGGYVAIMVPGDASSPDSGSFLSPAQWRELWRSPMVEIVASGMLEDGLSSRSK